MRKPKRIIFWAFSVEIVGPRSTTKAEDRRLHKALSKRLLGEIEEEVKRVTQSKLPHGFVAKVS